MIPINDAIVMLPQINNAGMGMSVISSSVTKRIAIDILCSVNKMINTDLSAFETSNTESLNVEHNLINKMADTQYVTTIYVAIDKSYNIFSALLSHNMADIAQLVVLIILNIQPQNMQF